MKHQHQCVSVQGPSRLPVGQNFRRARSSSWHARRRLAGADLDPHQLDQLGVGIDHASTRWAMLEASCGKEARIEAATRPAGDHARDQEQAWTRSGRRPAPERLPGAVEVRGLATLRPGRARFPRRPRGSRQPQARALRDGATSRTALPLSRFASARRK